MESLSNVPQGRSQSRVRAIFDLMLLHPNLLLLFVLGMALLLTRLALGSDRPFIYPTAGQSEEQLAEDRFECHRAAVDHSGFDPVHAALRQPLPAGPVAVAVPPNEKEGATAVGVVTGAVAGGALGAATHNDPGEFAAVSAVLGGLIGGAVESEGARDAEGIATAEAEVRMRDQQSQLAAREARKEAYRLAFAACMQGRGYIVR